MPRVYAPRIAAWLVSVLLIGTGTAAGLAGLHALTPAHTLTADESYQHVHGLIVAVDMDRTFAVQLPGHKAWLWLRCAPGAPISLAHLERHLQERAPTDVRYEVGQKGDLLAMDAD